MEKGEVTMHWQMSERKIPDMLIPKIIRKIPFENKVITELNQVWLYVLINKKPKYLFLYSFWQEPPSEKRLPKWHYLLSDPQVKKSIKRHKLKQSHPPSVNPT